MGKKFTPGIKDQLNAVLGQGERIGWGTGLEQRAPDFSFALYDLGQSVPVYKMGIILDLYFTRV